jgi:NitT/TauT family transport system substrate-binding protein
MIRIMVYRHSAFYSPLLGTVAGGFLENAGIQSRYFQKPKDRSLYEMFHAGEVDIMQAAVSTSWDPLSRGIRDIPRHFAQINQRDGFFIVARQHSGDFTWKDLEGSEILADHAQQPLAMLKYALHLQGVDWNRLNAIKVPDPDQMAQAFRAGRGNFVHLQGPAAQQLESEGHGAVVACVGDAMPALAFSSLMAMPAFLRTAEASAFMRAYRAALNWVNDAPAGEIAECESHLFEGVSRKALAETIARYQSLGTWRRDPLIPRDQYEVAMDAFIHAGVFKDRFSYEDVVYLGASSSEG